MTATAAEVRHPIDNDEGLVPACAGTDPDAWFPEHMGEIGFIASRKMLKRICEACPLQEQCLEWSLHHELSGVWGGYGERERRIMRAERGIELKTPEVDVLSRYFSAMYAEEGVRLTFERGDL